MSETITIRRPDDWHVHLRDGAMLAGVLHCTARQFARAIVMPNLVQPVVTAAEAEAYRGRIMAALPAGMDFTPLMAAYLTGATDPADIRAAKLAARPPATRRRTARSAPSSPPPPLRAAPPPRRR